MNNFRIDIYYNLDVNFFYIYYTTLFYIPFDNFYFSQVLIIIKILLLYIRQN